jgi:GLPGLI family protein
MKNLYLAFFLLVFISVRLAAQTPQKGLVVYNYIFIMDTVQGSIGTETESFLYFDVEKKQSVYVWNRKSNSKSKELVRTENLTYLKVKNGGTDPIGLMVYKDYKNNRIVERKGTKDVKIISDSFSLNWQIGVETKTLKDMILQKAECDFRGRHYIAWFNPKIPIPDGPWKLRGLPGLIIEAYDEKKHVQFNFTSLTLPADFTEKIEAPSDGTSVTYDCVKFTTAHYGKIRELTRAVTSKAEQLGSSVQGGGEAKTNLLERCY